MKKFLFIAFAVIALAANAQSEEGKTKKQFETKAGQYAVSVNATPVLNYVGNIFNGETNNSLSNFSFINGFGIYGKKYLTDDKAIRAGLNLSLSSMKSNVANIDSVAEGALESTRVSDNSIGIYGGLEYRKGTGRFQSFYGPMAMINFGAEKTKYNYNGTPSTYSSLYTGSQKTFEIGAGGFVGFEFFVTNNITLGTEAAVSLNYAYTSATKAKIQTGDDSTLEEETAGATSEFSFGFNNNSFSPTGKVYITIYL